MPEAKKVPAAAKTHFEEYIKSYRIPPYKKIMVGVDRPLVSVMILMRALALAKVSSSRLYIVHVLSTALPYQTKSEIAIEPAFYDIQMEFSKEILDYAKKAAAEAHIDAEIVLLEGDPAEEILRFTKEKGIDLVVMGSKDKVGSLKNLGSVSTRVAAEAGCSVLIER
ncbi:MAG: universal stress protein [Candidatus Verstraetearchaeota archaeon]|nr:universal stress protein [Candidatus Verstraetearchaeota archaeon]